MKGTKRAYGGRSLRESNRSTEYLGEFDVKIVVIAPSSSKPS